MSNWNKLILKNIEKCFRGLPVNHTSLAVHPSSQAKARRWWPYRSLNLIKTQETEAGLHFVAIPVGHR